MVAIWVTRGDREALDRQEGRRIAGIRVQRQVVGGARVSHASELLLVDAALLDEVTRGAWPAREARHRREGLHQTLPVPRAVVQLAQQA